MNTLTDTARPPRIDLLDLARAAALAAMFVYHFIWDLRFFDLIDTNLSTSQFFRITAHTIASAFLLISGVSLVLAHRSGIRWPAYIRHVAMIGGAAMLVTAGTAVLVPQGLVTFGILHCIAVASLVALPFLMLPAPAALVGGLAAIALPLLFRTPVLDSMWLNWIGLGVTEPRTFDWRPLLPWSGVMLFGVFAGKMMAGSAVEQRLAQWQGMAKPMRAALWAGRNSLTVYLVHQPVLMALLFAYVAATGGQALREDARVERECVRDCSAVGTARQTCERRCACTIGALKQSGIWEAVKANSLDAASRATLNSSILTCQRQHP